jgi:hypothetical protein
MFNRIHFKNKRMKNKKEVKKSYSIDLNPMSPIEKLLDKMLKSDGYVVLSVVNVEGTFKTKIDYSESMTPDIVDQLILNVAEVIKNRKL